MRRCGSAAAYSLTLTRAALHASPMVRADGGVEAAPKGEPAPLDSLAREALGQDPEAVRRFLLAISPAVLRACRAVIGPRHTDLEDTAQDCFIDVMRGLPGYRFEGSLLGYVTKIAVRRALVWRRRSVARVRHLQLLGDVENELPSQMRASRKSNAPRS
jgi:DNA-directed RNA polymerase specialized sigma24 family protein